MTTDRPNLESEPPAETSRPGLLRFLHRLAGDPMALPVEGRLASFDGATGWLNSEPLTPAGLRGKVVLVDFWTYTCVNWLRTLPYIRAWAAKYAANGLTIIGVHTPEFGFEHDLDNVAHCRASAWIGRSRSTTTTASGGRSATTSGRPSTSPMPTAGSDTTTSVRASYPMSRW